MTRQTELLVGVDLGGTKTEIAIARATDVVAGAIPSVLTRERCPTDTSRGEEGIRQQLASRIRAVVTDAGSSLDACAVGIGMPGGLDTEGRVQNSNTVCLNGTGFRQALAAALSPAKHVVFDNDANCFALAEATFGDSAALAAEGILFGVILGTGVGGGIAYRQRVWSGLHGIAGEWGHHRFSADASELCYCGHRGCVETVLAGPALERRYAARAGRAESVAGVARLAERGDAVAVEVLATYLDAFGRALANVINVLDPTVIVLGGGVSNLDALYVRGLREVARHVFSDRLRTPIRRHSLGDSAGVLGALWSAKTSASSERDAAVRARSLASLDDRD